MYDKFQRYLSFTIMREHRATKPENIQYQEMELDDVDSVDFYLGKSQKLILD